MLSNLQVTIGISSIGATTLVPQLGFKRLGMKTERECFRRALEGVYLELAYDGSAKYGLFESIEEHRKKVESLQRINEAKERNAKECIIFRNGRYAAFRRNKYGSKDWGSALPRHKRVGVEYWVVEFDKPYISACVLRDEVPEIRSIRDRNVVWKKKIGEVLYGRGSDPIKKMDNLEYQAQKTVQFISSSPHNPLADPWKKKRRRASK